MNAINVNAQSKIQAARARWAEKREWIAEQNRQYREEIRSKALSALALQDWLQEYVGEITRNGDEYTAVLYLPGCSPIQMVVWEWGTLRNFAVMEPVEVNYKDGVGWAAAGKWHNFYGSNDLDEAIDLAASHGESWSAMQVDADRRNATGFKPYPPEPTAWESAQDAMGNLRLLYGNPMASHKEASAAALAAIAEQLNLLNDTLSKMDR